MPALTPRCNPLFRAGANLFSDLRQYPLRGISFDASAFESSPQQARKAESVLTSMYGDMGYDLGAYCCMSILWGSYCLPVHVGFY